MRADFELVHRLFVDVRGAIHREASDIRRQRDWASNASAGALGGVNDLIGRLVYHAVVETFELNADFGAGHRELGQEERLGAGRSASGRLDDLLEDRGRDLLEIAGLHGIRSTSL